MCDITIAIINWNTRELLLDCLNSLPSGLAGILAKIVVVDNGSDDGSASLIQRSFPDIILIANDSNLGFARGNNQAYAIAQGRYFLLLNPDTIVKPNAIAEMVRFLDKHPEAVGVTCRFLNLDGSFQRYYKRLPSWCNVLFTFTILHNLTSRNRWVQEFYMKNDKFDQLMTVEQPPAACLMLRRNLLPSYTLFDEKFPIFFNDIDLCRTLKNHGHHLYYLPSAEVFHYGSGAGVGQMKDDAIIDYLIGLLRYFRKHEGFLSASILWSVLTMNSMLILLAWLVKVLLGKRTWLAFLNEYRRRARLIAGRELFRYELK